MHLQAGEVFQNIYAEKLFFMTCYFLIGFSLNYFGQNPILKTIVNRPITNLPNKLEFYILEDSYTFWHQNALNIYF